MDIGISRFAAMMGRARTLVQGARNTDPDSMVIDSTKTRLCPVLLIFDSSAR
tara:strand:- start:283 stop:438 length:156 start_codon:yes stop_codon:yes gene_type:complete